MRSRLFFEELLIIFLIGLVISGITNATALWTIITISIGYQIYKVAIILKKKTKENNSSVKNSEGYV